MITAPTLDGRAAVFAAIWDAFERGNLIVQCAWCRSVRLGVKWVVASPSVFSAIDAGPSLSHSICPGCAARLHACGLRVGREEMTDASIGLALVSSSEPSPSLGLDDTVGYLVADRSGRVIGRVETVMYGASQHTPDAVAVRFSIFRWRRLLVGAEHVAAIDSRTKVIGLRIDRDNLQAFL